jgi:hypothetical protein
MSTKRRLAGGLLAVGMLAVGLFGAISVTNPGTAQARCNGQGSEIISRYIQNGTELVAEFPHPGSCDGDSTYRGYLVSRYSGNVAVAVWVQDIPNVDFHRELRHSEDVDVWVPYAFQDRNTSSHANMRLCAATRSADYGCGWGTVEGGHGDNHGF